jgi:hypothetical protein
VPTGYLAITGRKWQGAVLFIKHYQDYGMMEDVKGRKCRVRGTDTAGDLRYLDIEEITATNRILRE